MAKKKIKFRIGLVLVAALLILAVVFCAYMIKTPIEEVVTSDTGREVITHDNNYSYETVSSQEQ